jgi:hypothetical protein
VHEFTFRFKDKVGGVVFGDEYVLKIEVVDPKMEEVNLLQ